MSKNLGLVRSIYADSERRDFSRVEWADPEIAVSQLWVAPNPAPSADWRRWDGRSTTGWAPRRTCAWRRRAIGELDDGRVVVLFRAFGRARITGLDLDRVGASVFEVRGGKVTRLVVYYDRDLPFADLGLKG
jgi:ketosteroid isomerase-like protein